MLEVVFLLLFGPFVIVVVVATPFYQTCGSVITANTRKRQTSKK